jgi:hypothetical protein
MPASKTKSLSIIVSAGDEAMVGEIANVYPLVSRHRICQLALRCGLRAIRLEPDRLVQEAQDGPAPERAGGGR